MTTLKPIIDRPKYSKQVETKIFNLLDDIIFKPIKDILTFEVFNNPDLIRDYLNRGQIQYVEGQFVGKFNSEITKALESAGAKYNKRTKTFFLPSEKVPHIVWSAITLSAALYEKAHLEIVNLLRVENIPNLISAFNIDLQDAIVDLENQFRFSIAKHIAVYPELSEAQKGILNKEYTTNLQKYVKNFAEEEILKLRQLVEANAEKGARADTLAKIIQKEFNITKNKARFLARQETSLFVAKFRQLRYGAVGITTYKWSTSKDERVRPMHKELDQTTQSFNNPPITSPQGDKNNPGEDFNCRCVPIPIIED